MNAKVVESINRLDHLMQKQNPVYNTNNQKIGAVRQFELTAGSMQALHGGLDAEMFYILILVPPIASIDFGRTARRVPALLRNDACILAHRSTTPILGVKREAANHGEGSLGYFAFGCSFRNTGPGR